MKAKTPWHSTNGGLFGRIKKYCEKCGVQVMRVPSGFKNPRVFCSKKCANSCRGRRKSERVL